MISATRIPLRKVRELGADLRGIAAVEFALVLPFLLLLFVGMAELTSALNQSQKVSQAARSVADLVAQAETITNTDLTDIGDAAEQILEPYTDSTLDVIIASITFDKEGIPRVDWSWGRHTNTPWPIGDPAPIDISEDISIPGTSLVIGYAESVYTPTLSGLTENLIPGLADLKLKDIYFLKPRLTASVILE